MPYRRPPRLHDSCYVGANRVFLTMCTFERRKYFSDPVRTKEIVEQLLSVAAQWGVEIIAYCFMTDHLHVLVEGVSEQADSRKCADAFRRVSGFHFKRARGRRLWQEGYYDHVL